MEQNIKRKSRNGSKDRKPRIRSYNTMPTVHVYGYKQFTFLQAFRKEGNNRIFVKEYFDDTNYNDRLLSFLDKYYNTFNIHYTGQIYFII